MRRDSQRGERQSQSTQTILDARDLTIVDASDETLGGTHLATKPGRFTVFWAEFSTIFWMHFNFKRHQRLLLLIPTITILGFSLSVAFLYFQLPNTPEAAPSRLWVLIINAIYFTAATNLHYFNSFEGDRHLLLPGAERPALGIHFNAATVWLGRYLAEMPSFIFLAILGTAIVYPIVGLRDGFGWYMLFLLALVLQAFGSGAYGLAISAAFPDPLLGAYVAVVFFSLNILFSGVFYTSSTVSWILLWMRYLSATFYAGQILIYDQFSGVVYPNTLITGDDVLEAQGWLVQSLSISIIGSLSLILLFNIIGIFFLWRTSRLRLIYGTSSSVN